MTMAVATPCSVVAAETSAEDPIEAYRSFLSAIDEAESFEDLLPYLPARAVEQLKQLEPEQAASHFQRLREIDGGGEIVAQRTDDSSSQLTLRKEITEGPHTVTLEAGAKLDREDSGWKVTRPPMKWTRVAVLPTDPQARGAAPPLGGGATDGGIYAPTDWQPVAFLDGEEEERAVEIVFDPRGTYVALLRGSARRDLAIFELEGLKPMWTARRNSDHGSMSVGFDGRSLAFTTHGDGPEIIPLDLNLNGDPPEEGYFFSQPLLKEAGAVLGARPMWTGIAHHPTEPILALGIGDYEDDGRGAIVFQPAGEALWLSSASGDPSSWNLSGAPWKMNWSPSGDRIAWVPTSNLDSPRPGAPVYVKNYPSGEDSIALSHPDFTPMTMVGFDSDGKRFASLGSLGGQSGGVVWDSASGEVLATFPNVDRLAFAPDGIHLLAVRSLMWTEIEPGVAHEILVLKPGAAEPVEILAAFPPEEGEEPRVIDGLAVSPNGRFLIAVSNEGDVRLWDGEGRD